MPHIVDLDKVVPEDVVFKYRGEEYVFPGDIDADTVLVLVKLVNDLARAEGQVEGVDRDDGKARRVGKQLDDELLKLFQVSQPDLERLPFGAHALSMVVGTILSQLGFMDGAGEADSEGKQDPTRPAARPAGKKAIPKSKPRSRRSSGSSPSRKS